MHWPLAFPEVFLEQGHHGFDAVVGNPPFLGGKRISARVGSDYREFLVDFIADGKKGNADLVSYFFLRASQVADCFGLLATNSIGQGDSRVVGLERLVNAGWTLSRGMKSSPWPGAAALEISKVWATRGEWTGSVTLDGEPVRMISASLEAATANTVPPGRLRANSGQSFQGCILATQAFIVDRGTIQQLVNNDPTSLDVIRPYLSGVDVTDDPKQTARRHVLDFRDWPEERARAHAACWKYAEGAIRPKVLEKKKSYVSWHSRWWQFWNLRPGLRAAIADLKKVIVFVRVSKTMIPVLVDADQVHSDRLAIVAREDFGTLAALSSSAHWWWALTHGGKHETRPTYDPTRCFETFVFPPDIAELADIGERLESHRRGLMCDRNEGITITYNRVHDPNEDAEDVCALREFHKALDETMSKIYGWEDLDQAHGFWETSQGMRFTIGPEARVEVLKRLLEMNRDREATESDRARMRPNRPRASKRPVSKGEQASGSLFGDDDMARNS
jgi:hypothetical protein